MKTLREMIDLIESAQSGRPELRTWGNRSTGETHYSVDGVEVGKDQYYQAWRADQKNQGNPDIKEGIPNDLTPYEAGEAAGLSGEYYENPYPEGSKRHAEFRLGWRDGTKQAEANRDIDEDQATAKMGLMSAMGSNDNNLADQRRVMAQQAVEQLAAKR
jgi:hypothetical protein